MALPGGTSSEPHSDPASCRSLSDSHEIDSRGTSLFDEPALRGEMKSLLLRVIKQVSCSEIKTKINITTVLIIMRQKLQVITNEFLRHLV